MGVLREGGGGIEGGGGGIEGGGGGIEGGGGGIEGGGGTIQGRSFSSSSHFSGKIGNAESFRGSICNKKLKIPQLGITMN